MYNNRLIKEQPGQAICGEFSDDLTAVAYSIENALLSIDAVPNKDYKLLDLFTLAQPYMEKLHPDLSVADFDYPFEDVEPLK